MKSAQAGPKRSRRFAWSGLRVFLEKVAMRFSLIVAFLMGVGLLVAGCRVPAGVIMPPAPTRTNLRRCGFGAVLRAGVGDVTRFMGWAPVGLDPSRGDPGRDWRSL